MDKSNKKKQSKNKLNEVTTFQVPFALGEIKATISHPTQRSLSPNREKLIQQAIKFHSEGNTSEAIKNYQYCINQGFNDYRVFSNYGAILKDLGKLQEAEISVRKAIEIEPGLADAHSNLAGILKDLGKLKEAELSLRKAIKLKPGFADAHYNLGLILRDLGKFQDAELSQIKAIKQKPDFAMAYSSLGNILKDLGKLKEAELSLRKAIKLKPELANSHYNLAITLTQIGKLKEAELSLLNAIELKPEFAEAYYSLSTMKDSKDIKRWKKHLFSENILNNKSNKEKTNIYFARENLFYKEKKYKESSKCLKLANELKLATHPSKPEIYLNKSRILFSQSEKLVTIKKDYIHPPESIFIVGMPRSGSTLLESILSMNKSVEDLGEINILEDSYLEHKNSAKDLTLAELYWKKAFKYKNDSNITTNKWLYNYQYSAIIAKQIPNSKIIHCFRNPLDNILSIYRAHFAKGNEYSSSLVDCAKVYLDQDEIMTEYKKRFRSIIYDLNYDLLVLNPIKEIKSLIVWLGWQWDDSYLSPHLNTRSVLTRSNVEVRSPINSKSVGGWQNYREMLQPVKEIIRKIEKYKNL